MKVIINDVQFIPAPTPAEGKGLDAALDVRFDSDAGSQLTVREYLCKLLLTLWREEECFSGKRPFGNSGWQSDLFNPLARGGFIDLGELVDNWGGVDYYYGTEEQREAADEYVEQLIKRALERP